jgi:hypothetical protein
VQLNQQLQGLETGKVDALEALRQQRADARYAFRTQRADIRDARRQGIMDVSMDALERGISGSTVDWHQRTGVRADAAKQLQRAEHAKTQALTRNLLARLQTKRDYKLGVQNVAQTKAALQQEANVDRFANDQVMGLGVKAPPGPSWEDYGYNPSGGSTGGSGGGGASGGGTLSGEAKARESAVVGQINTLMDKLRTAPVTASDGTPNRQRVALIQELYDLWSERNKILVSAGLQPYRQRILKRRINRIGG